jgi:chromosomal replication initiator protein
VDISTGSSEQGATTFAGSYLDTRFVFETFLGDSSNQSVLETIMSVAAPVLKPENRLLYIWGRTGLGKTHLLQASIHAAIANGRQALYVTADRVMHQLATNTSGADVTQFEDFVSNFELVAFDRVEYLSGKAITETFGNILRRMMAEGKTVVLAADRPAKLLSSIDPETVELMHSGRAFALDVPKIDTRVAILESLLARKRDQRFIFTLSAPACAYIVETLFDGASLARAVDRIAANTVRNTTEPLSIEFVRSMLKDLPRSSAARHIRIEYIQKLVADHYNVSYADILSTRRTARVVRPRQVAMYLAKTYTTRSIPEVGRRFGGRDHTTVLHAVHKIENLRKKDRVLDHQLESLIRMLE